MTIYLDQSDLSNLARGVVDPNLAQEFREQCECGLLSPVYSILHLYETLKHPNNETRNQIATYADSLINSKWILMWDVIIRKEIEKAFFEFHGFPQPPIKPIKEKLKHVLYEGMREPIEIINKEYGFAATLFEIAEDPSLFHQWKSIANSFPPIKALLSTAAVKQGAANIIREVRNRWVDFIRRMIPSRIPNGEVVTPAQRDAFIQAGYTAIIQECHAFHLMNQVTEEIARDVASSVDPSQLPDLAHLSALPYVDLFLCDNRTREYVRRARLPAVFSRCFSDLREILAQVRNPSKNHSG